jgi:hypothetical protein
MEDSKRQLSIYEALPLAMAGIGAIAKASKVDFAKWTYRGIDAVMNAANPVLSEHGITVVPWVESISVEPSGKGHYVHGLVKVTFYGPDGSHVDCRVFSEALDTSDKAAGKLMSYALRYAVTQVLMVPTEETALDNEADNIQLSRAKADPAHDGIPMTGLEGEAAADAEFARQGAVARLVAMVDAMDEVRRAACVHYLLKALGAESLESMSLEVATRAIAMVEKSNRLASVSAVAGK